MLRCWAKVFGVKINNKSRQQSTQYVLYLANCLDFANIVIR